VAPSIIEKYEQILAADPRSRIFVELARALVERGDHARAVQVCHLGLEHHPSSILGRVTWGRALLLTGDARAAHDQFEIAIGIDPANPYAYNLVGEALCKAGLFKEALPVLTRAAELQPADAKVRAALEDARRRAGGGTVPAMAAVTAAAPAEAPVTPDAPASPGVPAGRATQLAVPAAQPAEATGPNGPVSVPVDLELTDRLPLPAAPADADRTEELTLRLSLGPLEGEDEEERLSLDSMEEQGDARPSTTPVAPRPTTPPGPPPVLARGGKKGPPGPRTLLTMIPPGAPAAPPATTPAAAPSAPDAAEAARIAAAYERELREKAAQAAAAVPPPPPRRRALVAGVALVLVGGAAIGAYLYVDGQTREQTAQRAVVEARAGLARDTRASLQAAAEVLASARRSPPSAPEVRAQLASLAAQVAALRAVDHGDAEARALARQLADDPAAGDGGLVARLLLSEKPAERAAAESTVLASRPGDAPQLQRLAGHLLVQKGQLEGGRGRLRIAAQATPPLLGALCDLGDSYLAGGDPEAALPLFEAAIAAHATHPRAVLGAAEARLALERPLEGTLAELQAVEADAGSAPPQQARLRWEVAYARVLAARGDTAAASRRLKLAAGGLGESAGLEAARAGLLLDGRDFEQAEEAAARAVRLDPKSADHRVALARARIGLHRHQGAIQALLGFDGRPVWLARGIALSGLGQYGQARAALEKTVRNGKMPTEAATHYALADLALGRAEAALSLLEKLAAGKASGASVHAAHGRALLSVRRLDEAEVACRRAVERGPKVPDGPLCLGRVLVAAGKLDEAVAPLEQAVALDRNDPEAARLLAVAKTPKPAPPPPKRPTPVPPKTPPRRK
jgi:tetratricopeptide (TPR) repeat protein